MTPQLTALEARLIGCLIEKQITTPEQYPLSIHALQLACNQKSNRDPVLALSEQQVQALVDGLVRKHLIIEKSGFGSRVPKFQQRFCNTEFSALQFTAQQRAIVCELLLRGPQTPGELRSRAARMAPFADAGEVESALEQLRQHASGALVVRLAREAGRRESRFAHLFSGPVEAAVPTGADPTAPEPPGAALASEASPEADAGRLARLEAEVTALRVELAALRVEFAALRERLGAQSTGE
jgi:uncharacterized protein YceH (UPF0502 family)